MTIPPRCSGLLITCVAAFTGCFVNTDESQPPPQELVIAPLSADGLSQNFTGNTDAVPPSSKAITSFSFSTISNPGLSRNFTGTITGTSIGAAVPPGTDLTHLVAS